jgi:hypothetical protein
MLTPATPDLVGAPDDGAAAGAPELAAADDADDPAAAAEGRAAEVAATKPSPTAGPEDEAAVDAPDVQPIANTASRPASAAAAPIRIGRLADVDPALSRISFSPRRWRPSATSERPTDLLESSRRGSRTRRIHRP